jgi:small subunit ribosomal protein S20
VKVFELANIKQQKKRDITNEKRRVKNSQVKSTIRTAAKKVGKAADLKDNKDVAVIQESYQSFIKIIDTAASKGIIKKSTAARKKSRLARKVNSAVAAINKTA